MLRHGLIALAAASLAAPALAAQPLPDAPNPEALGFSAARLKLLDDRMEQVVTDGEAAGVSTMVVRHGQVADFKLHGLASLETRAPMRRDTIFRIYSMSKPITATAMMILFEQGKWKLDDPVSKFISEFKDLKVMTGVDASGRPILEAPKHAPTMRELMSHQAGFAYGGMGGPAGWDDLFKSADIMNGKGLPEMVRRLATLPLTYQPGERWVYSVSVDIQGAIVERLSGQTFGQFLQTHIFGPLKMEDTGFLVPKDEIGRLAAVYSTDPKTGKLVDASARGGPPRDYTQAPSVESGGGGLLSTIDDYARFAQMLTNGGELDGVRLLSPAAVELMRTSVLTEASMKDPTVRFNRNNGFGLDGEVMVHPREAGGMEGAGTYSWEGAAGTIFWTDPTNDVVYVGMIQNFSRAGPFNSLNSIARPLVYQALVDPKK